MIHCKTILKIEVKQKILKMGSYDNILNFEVYFFNSKSVINYFQNKHYF
ncbi:hypothetical protein NU08_0513 [Flavobacterium anhuiense]|uniref:Uncharacterized protein n=1 Tax=Flavobacterium anhuiense TaxID=459526 RepID=A0A444W5S3_9FLAO|nr:hypothetical protein NU08_0513 [Flavobacterium anhuiense]